MKVFSEKKFIEILDMDGWEHEVYLTKKENDEYNFGKIGTTSSIKYKGERLLLTCYRKWGIDGIYWDIDFHSSKNFIVYNEEDEEILDFNELLKTLDSIKYKSFLQYDKDLALKLSFKNEEDYLQEMKKREESRESYYALLNKYNDDDDD